MNKNYMLGRGLSVIERALLVNLTYHEGYKVLIKLFDECCQLATEDVMKINPLETPDYEKKIAYAQLDARATHSVCASILKSIQTHKDASIQEDKEGEEDRALMARFASLKQKLIEEENK